MTEKETLVSVIIPAFNTSETLGTTIESALVQKDAKIEIMVVDDGSTDETLAVANKYLEHIQVVTGPNRGVSKARNRGIAETNSQWIVFLDSDDVLAEGTLKKRMDAADRTGADVVICDWEEGLFHDEEMFAGEIKHISMTALEAESEIACATNVWAPPAAIMYRRSLVEKIAGFREDLRVIQDARFLFDAAYNGARFAHSDHVGARYRIRRESLSRGNASEFWKDVFTNGKQIEVLWRDRGTLDNPRRRALAGIYDHAARGLFDSGQPEYFEAVDHLRRLGGKLARHPRFVAPLARALGLRRTKWILKLLSR